MKIEITTPPVGDVVTLTELKGYLRLDVSDTSEDTILQLFIDAAVDNCQRFTSRVLLPTGFTATKKMINYSTRLDLTKTPLTNIDSAQYNIGDGLVTSTDSREGLDDYPYFLFQDSAITLDRDNIFVVIFTAGYTTIPPLLKLGVLQLASFYYENRGDCNCTELSKLPAAIKGSFMSYRVLPI